jgi:hypothetical protein
MVAEFHKHPKGTSQTRSFQTHSSTPQHNKTRMHEQFPVDYCLHNKILDSY